MTRLFNLKNGSYSGNIQLCWTDEVNWFWIFQYCESSFDSTSKSWHV